MAFRANVSAMDGWNYMECAPRALENSRGYAHHRGSQTKSEHMQSISKKKWSTTSQMKAIQRKVVSRLVSLWNHVALMCDLYQNYIWRCVCQLLYVLTFVLNGFVDNAEESYNVEVDAEVAI